MARGRPDKEQSLKNKENRVKKDLAEKVLKGKEIAVENYDKYIEALNDYALGNIESASHTNRISTIKYMLEYCEKLLEEEEASKSNQEDNDTEEKPIVKQEVKSSLLSQMY